MVEDKLTMLALKSAKAAREFANEQIEDHKLQILAAREFGAEDRDIQDHLDAIRAWNKALYIIEEALVEARRSYKEERL